MNNMKGKKSLFGIKVDLAKAYDRMSWEFVNEVLIEAGFPLELINVIMIGISSVNTNVLWN